MKVCLLLVDDHEDMIEKALSWALRELVVHDAGAVRDFTDAVRSEAGVAGEARGWQQAEHRSEVTEKEEHARKESSLVLGRENGCPNVAWSGMKYHDGQNPHQSA